MSRMFYVRETACGRKKPTNIATYYRYLSLNLAFVFFLGTRTLVSWWSDVRRLWWPETSPGQPWTVSKTRSRIRARSWPPSKRHSTREYSILGEMSLHWWMPTPDHSSLVVEVCRSLHCRVWHCPHSWPRPLLPQLHLHPFATSGSPIDDDQCSTV